MGDTSIIARRLSAEYVQYGWGGNGGVYYPSGEILLEDYKDPNTVEYLFSLGQLAHIWFPHSEETGSVFANRPTGQPHWVGRSEREERGGDHPEAQGGTPHRDHLLVRRTWR